MKLNHLNLCVENLEQAIALFERHFHFTLQGCRGQALAILHGEDDFLLVLSRAGGAPTPYPDGFHVGFVVTDRARVDRMFNELCAGGVHVERPPQVMRGSYALYFTALGGVLFEVSCPVAVTADRGHTDLI